MKMEILDIARWEYDEAEEFYEAEQSGLVPNSRNRSDIPFYALNNTLKYGRRSARKSDDTSSTSSPIKILYSIQDDKIVVLAFAHLHRQPDYWIDRLK